MTEQQIDKQPNLKWAKDLNRGFLKEDIHMPSTYMYVQYINDVNIIGN